jgi:KamA family protein
MQIDSAAELEAKFRTRISPFVTRHAATLGPAEAEKLLRQFTPDARELELHDDFIADPLSEEDADIHPFPDVVHKYRSKILYLTTDECPVYCRYCTRKRKTLLSQGHGHSSLEKILTYLRLRPEINEVIFSGGDPLMLSSGDLAYRANAFLELKTIRFLRFHTRAFTTVPGLISDKFIAALTALREKFSEKQIIFVLHINTAAELSDEAVSKIQAVRRLEIPLYSQSVLLKNINDSAETLARMCEALLAVGVQPYYLHQLDRVSGSAHFEVPEPEARQIYKELKTLIPPYMLPKLVRDSKHGKYPL